jgi:Dyp-type peroxidase family
MCFLDLMRITKEQVKENAAFWNIQGCCLINHGRKHVWFAFLRFKEPLNEEQTKAIRSAIADYGRRAARASELYDSYDSALDAENKAPAERALLKKSLTSGLVVAVGVSSRGYRVLSEAAKPFDIGFREGFANRNRKAIECGAQDPQYDAVIVLASDHPETQLESEKEQVDSLLGEKGYADLDWEEGFIIKKDKVVRDHFGFPEGISQPEFFEIDHHGRTNTWKSGWDPSASLSLVLVRDASAQDEHEYGSYMAFVKMQQSVNPDDRESFEGRVNELAKLTGKEQDEVKSWILGRKMSGDPLMAGGADRNDFDFSSDAGFAECPGAAHIRKMNPRSPHTRNHRILRRGVSYHNADTGEKGVLFHCFQSKLETGFEHLFRRWGASEDLPETAGGIDGVLGTRDWPPMPSGIRVVLPKRRSPLASVTTVKWGEYFYFPSIRFFERL